MTILIFMIEILIRGKTAFILRHGPSIVLSGHQLIFYMVPPRSIHRATLVVITGTITVKSLH